MSIEQLGRVIAGRLQEGQTIGIGSGSTVERIVEVIGRRLRREKLAVYGVPTSFRAARCAEGAGFITLPLTTSRPIEWAFDGADEVDGDLNLLKGKGGALLAEKIVAQRAGGLTVVITPEKLVSRLGERHLLPVEIVPGAALDVERQLRNLGAQKVELRRATEKYGPVVTEHGNVLLDVHFDELSSSLEREIKGLVGVVETGFFPRLTREVLIAESDGITSRRHDAAGSVVAEKVVLQ